VRVTDPPHADPPSVPVQPDRPAGAIELLASSEAVVGGARVRRALPHRPRRTVGAWCFADHLGPVTVAAGGTGSSSRGIEVGPHPHIGLQTVTWLTGGELLHRDSLGSEQVIRPGQLNLMTAGHGVSHAEESTGRYSGRLEGIQLWVAQPERTRSGAPAFEHHPELPRYELPDGEVTVLVGASGEVSSPARRDTDHVGMQVLLRGSTVSLPAEPTYEYAVVVLEGAVRLRLPGAADPEPVVAEPGQLA
jgi:quercetin 2,3-dioxygenase